MHAVSRRDFLGTIAAGLVYAHRAPAQAPTRKLNVLHILSDDLCCRLGCYGDPMAKTPNLDRLAARGVRFDRAYCQYPLCNPSRASIMTGLRPDTTKVYDNQVYFRDVVPDVVTIPQSFKKAGYNVARVGKIYHYGVPSQIGTDGLDDAVSWEKVVNPKGRDIDDIGIVEVLALDADGKATTVTGKELKDTGGTLSWLAAEGADSDQTDGLGAAAAIRMLEERAADSKPFYLAVGFYRPHTPFIAPKAYFDQYPRDRITLPTVPPNLKELFPAPALATQRPAQTTMSDDLRRTAIQAYYASVSFMDAQVGLLLDALERLQLDDDTIVVFNSDHGYHLGEKDLWQKQSIFEESARVPLIISVPGNAANGKASARPVELVSLHMTLTDLCGIEVDSKTQGHSMRPLVENPEAEWKHAAYSQVERRPPKNDPSPPVMGRSVRTNRWRYTEWNEGAAGVELYDHNTDPEEMRNLANDTQYKSVVEELKTLLHRRGK